MSTMTDRRMTRTPTGVYFTGSLAIPTAHGKVDLGLLARALLSGVTARRLNSDLWEVQSTNRLLRGPYHVQLDGAGAACTCPAGSHGAPCTHAAVCRTLAALEEPSA